MSSQQQRKKRKAEDIEDIEPEDGVKAVKAHEEIDKSEDESEDSEEDSDVDSDDSEDNQFINKEIQIDFSAYQPIGEDLDGIKTLLSQLWLKEPISVSDLAQLLINQNTICSVLKQDEGQEDKEEAEEDKKSEDSEEDLDVYGVTSVIPFANYREKDCIKQIEKTLISYIPKDKPKVNQIMTESIETIGLIVNERFANLPPKISLPSYTELLNDMKSAKSVEPNKYRLDFDWFLIVCKILKQKTNNNKKANDSDDSDVLYVNAEEELFDELCDHRYEYSVANQCDADVFDWKDDQNLLEPFRRVLLLSDQNWNKAINRLKEEFK